MLRPRARGRTGGSVRSTPARRAQTLPMQGRHDALPTLKEAFVGYYRWHAKRTLREVERVRVVRLAKKIVAVSMAERLGPQVGYVSYLAVARPQRNQGLGGLLLDDALRWFRTRKVHVVFAAAQSTNRISLALLRSRGFRATRRRERSWKEGGLGAWGLRSRMHIVRGELLLALRLARGKATSRPRGS